MNSLEIRMNSTQQNSMRRELFICLLLAAMTLAAYWPVGQLGFILFDDYAYVVKNANVQGGITAKSVYWAFTATHAGYWLPLTWLSHMLDCELFGLNAQGHHWMNLGFHIANTLLLFIVLRELTQTVWRSALAAALFALHPLRVESVAWIAERKDVLSGFFFLLTLLFYTRFAQATSLRTVTLDAKSGDKGSGVWHLGSGDYWLALVFFALGLMSKPMLVTLPFVLLLLDFWPLGRISDFRFRISDLKNAVQHPVLRRLLWEKLPFVALSLASGIITIWAQQNGGATVPAGVLPWYWRAANALVFYTDYLGKIFWPENLAIFYPYPRMQVWEFVCSALVPVLLSVLCIRRARVQPYLLVGWFWYVVMLVPVIGLGQAGMQAIADRFTYLPSIGLAIVVAWGLAGIASRSGFWRTAVSLGAAVWLSVCLLLTRHQLGYWRDNVTLFSHALEVTRENNFTSYLMLGNTYLESGSLDQAAENYRCALQIIPTSKIVRYQLGHILLLQKKFEEAEVQFGEITRLSPEDAFAHKCLGYTLAEQSKYAEAEAEYATGLQLSPGDSALRNALALVAQRAETAKTLANLYAALKIQPTPEVHTEIAAIETIQGNFQSALGHYQAALQLKPDSPDVLNNLAWLLATSPEANVRDGERAMELAEHACTLTDFKQTMFVGTLAAAYAEAGRFDEAMATAEKACVLATAAGDQDLLIRNQELLALYRKHQPYHEVAATNQSDPAVLDLADSPGKPVPTGP